jgi:hypothetical protein
MGKEKATERQSLTESESVIESSMLERLERCSECETGRETG